MNQTEKVARWYFNQFASVDGPDWEEVPQHTRDNCFKATSEIIALIDQQAEPVAFIDRDDLESLILSHTQTKGVVGYKYKDAVPLHLDPPASREREALLRLRTEVNCRIEHGAESGGHLEFVQEQLDAILDGNKTIDSGPGRGE